MELHDRLAALSHPQRLALLQLLLRRHPQPVPAGSLSDILGLKPNTLSNYLNSLRQAGLIQQNRRGTSLLYSVDMAGLNTLMGGIHAGCCNNRPDLCETAFPLPGASPMPTTDTSLNVLFLCSANSARSLMAEALLRHHGGDRFNAYSAGLDPSLGPRPEVLALLQEKGIDTSDLTSKSRDLFAMPNSPSMDFVFTVCDLAADEECPAWSGQPLSAHWGQPDPVKARGTEAEKQTAYQHAYGILKNRITAFTSLPIDTLDRISLQRRIDDIGVVENA